MSVVIAEHGAKLEREQVEMLARFNANRAELQTQIAAKLELKKKLEIDKKKKDRLLAENQSVGLDTARLATLIAEVETQISQVAGELEKIQTAYETPADFKQRDFARHRLFAETLEKHFNCREAVSVATEDECWPQLPTNVTEWDAAGRPAKCTVGFGAHEAKSLPVIGSPQRFRADFIPPALSWLPKSAILLSSKKELHDQDAAPTIFAFCDARRNLILSRTKLSWQTRVTTAYGQWNRQEQSEYKNHAEDFSDIALSLSARFDQLTNGEHGQLDLEKPYVDCALMRHMKSVVLAQTTAAPIFVPATTEALTSAAILKVIKADWTAFEAAPWSGKIRGSLALLKYSVENGEKARFWGGQFVGHYGFRLRTRDHDWLVGEVYLANGELQNTEPKEIQVHQDYGSEQTMQMGRMWLRVRREH